MVSRVHTRLLLPPQAPTWSLDYEKCTTTELQKFFEECTGTQLSKGQLRKVQRCGIYPLIDGLRKMDRERVFLGFMQLPPELRLGVYEALIIVAEGKPKQEGVPRLHPAVLRTSKQVYSEAMPVLYKQNKFRAEIINCEQLPWPRRSGSTPFCALLVHQPGGGHSFYHRMDTGVFSILRRLFDHPATIHMLRMLTHLTLNIYLVTRQAKQDSHEYSVKACNTMKSLCLALAGAIRLEKLTIVVKPGDQDSSDVDLADILWPLLLLRTDVKVEFEGITADPEEASTMEWETGSEEELAFGRQMGQVQRLCNSELERPGWEERCWAFNSMCDAEAVLYTSAPPGKRLSLYDVISMSRVWKGIQREVNCAEVSDLG